MHFSSYCYITLAYEKEHKCSYIKSVSVSRKSHPFIAVTAIENPDSNSFGFIRVKSSRPSSDPRTSYNGKLTEGNFELKYRARCVYGRNVSSVCDVFFVVNNTKDWASSTTFTLSEATNQYASYYIYNLYIENSPRKVMLGYTMLSRTAGRLVTKVQMESTLKKMLQPFKNYTWSSI
ncbi:uncharacterized protein LOC144746964 [Ciona intestinalis]